MGIETSSSPHFVVCGLVFIYSATLLGLIVCTLISFCVMEILLISKQYQGSYRRSNHRVYWAFRKLAFNDEDPRTDIQPACTRFMLALNFRQNIPCRHVYRVSQHHLWRDYENSASGEEHCLRIYAYSCIYAYEYIVSVGGFNPSQFP